MDSLKTKLFDLRFEIYRQDFQKETIDLTSGEAQRIAYGFLVSDLKVEQQENGVHVSGRIINSSAIGYENTVFKINIYGKENEIHIDELMPGGSSPFQITIPEVPFDDIKVALITHEYGKIKYR